MQAYILTIAGVILFSAVITILAPHGKMGTFLKGMSKLVILCALVAPIVQFFSGEVTVPQGSDPAFDTAYFAFCADECAKEDAESIENFLFKEYGAETDVVVRRNADMTFSYEKISVEILNPGIFDMDEHIHISEEIERRLEAIYGCEAEVV